MKEVATNKSHIQNARKGIFPIRRGMCDMLILLASKHLILQLC